MIPRNVANRFANVMGVDRHIAQPEIVRLHALRTLHDAGMLDRTVFTGGTYLRTMVTGDVGRLSEDLDFTNAGRPDDPRPPIEAAFAAARHGAASDVVAPYRTERRNWGCEVGYRHEWDRGTFRLQVSYREAPFLPPARWSPLPQPYFRSSPFPMFEIASLRVE